MRRHLSRLAVATVVAVLTFPAVTAADGLPRPSKPAASPVASARRDARLAELRLRQYLKVEHPLALRKLASEIRLAEAELAVWNRRIKEYQDLDRFSDSQLFLITLDDARLDALRLETTLSDLKEERSLLLKHHADRREILELDLEAARARQASLR